MSGATPEARARRRRRARTRRSSHASNEPNDEEQDERADHGDEQRAEEAAANADVQDPGQPSAHERADYPDEDVDKQAETPSFRNQPGEPAREGPDDQPDDETVMHVYFSEGPECVLDAYAARLSGGIRPSERGAAHAVYLVVPRFGCLATCSDNCLRPPAYIVALLGIDSLAKGTAGLRRVL